MQPMTSRTTMSCVASGAGTIVELGPDDNVTEPFGPP